MSSIDHPPISPPPILAVSPGGVVGVEVGAWLSVAAPRGGMPNITFKPFSGIAVPGGAGFYFLVQGQCCSVSVLNTGSHPQRHTGSNFQWIWGTV